MEFVWTSFNIDNNKILNMDPKLKEVVIKKFVDNFVTLALYPNHYRKADILQLRIDLELKHS